MSESDPDRIDSLSFEEALAQLEEIVQTLERGEVSLEDSIDLYERGAALRELCTRKLNEAKMRIERVVGGGAGVVPLDGGGAASRQAPAGVEDPLDWPPARRRRRTS